MYVKERVEKLPSLLSSPPSAPLSPSLSSSPRTTVTASQLKGSTHDFRNPPQTFDGDTACSQATRNVRLKFNLVMTKPGFLW